MKLLYLQIENAHTHIGCKPSLFYLWIHIPLYPPTSSDLQSKSYFLVFNHLCRRFLAKIDVLTIQEYQLGGWPSFPAATRHQVPFAPVQHQQRVRQKRQQKLAALWMTAAAGLKGCSPHRSLKSNVLLTLRSHSSKLSNSL